MAIGRPWIPGSETTGNRVGAISGANDNGEFHGASPYFWAVAIFYIFLGRSHFLYVVFFARPAAVVKVT